MSTLAVQSPVDLANVALTRIGFKGRIGNLYDGSAAAKKILDIYSQTRDELLRSADWGFAERNVVATLLKTAPAGGYFPPVAWDPTTNPPPPWTYSYVYPSDCLKVRAIKSAAGFVQNYDPQPFTFSIENDGTYTPPQRVVLCNLQYAVLVYTGQITDPTTWDEGFDEQFAAILGKRLAPSLVGIDAEKAAAQDEMIDKQTADMEQG